MARAKIEALSYSLINLRADNSIQLAETSHRNPLSWQVGKKISFHVFMAPKFASLKMTANWPLPGLMP